MKRLKHLVFLILLMFPLFVSAKNIIMTLDYQTNTNAYTDGTIGDIFVYSMNDYYFIYYDNYNSGAVDVRNYLAVDKKGKVKYSELDIWEEVLYAGDRVFLLTWDRRYVSSNNYENKILITEINPKTNDIINTLGEIVSNELVPRGTKHIYKVKSDVTKDELLANTKWQKIVNNK